MRKKDEVLKWLKNRVDSNVGCTITNWHISDDLLEFMDEFFDGDKTTIKQGQNSFNRYTKMLVEEGFLFKPEKIGLGAGGYSEFGVRTQTIWRKNTGHKEYHQKIKGLSYSRYEHDYFKKHGRFPKNK